MYVREKCQKYTYVHQKCACFAFMTRQMCLGTCAHVPGFCAPLDWASLGRQRAREGPAELGP